MTDAGRTCGRRPPRGRGARSSGWSRWRAIPSATSPMVRSDSSIRPLDLKPASTVKLPPWPNDCSLPTTTPTIPASGELPGGWLRSAWSWVGRRTPAAARQSDLESGDSVVDLGCGPGVAVRYVARLGATVTGVDPAPVMLRWRACSPATCPGFGTPTAVPSRSRCPMGRPPWSGRSPACITGRTSMPPSAKCVGCSSPVAGSSPSSGAWHRVREATATAGRGTGGRVPGPMRGPRIRRVARRAVDPGPPSDDQRHRSGILKLPHRPPGPRLVRGSDGRDSMGG